MAKPYLEKKLLILKKYGDPNDISITSESYVNTRKPIILSGEECNNYNSVNNYNNNSNNSSEGPNGEENTVGSNDFYDNMLAGGNSNTNNNGNNMNNNGNNMNNNGNNMNNNGTNNSRRNDPNVIGNQNMVAPSMNNNNNNNNNSNNNVQPRNNGNVYSEQGVPSPQNMLGSSGNTQSTQEEESTGDFNWKPGYSVKAPFKLIDHATTDFGTIKKGRQLSWSLPKNDRSQEACGKFCQGGGYSACSYQADGCWGGHNGLWNPNKPHVYAGTNIRNPAQPEEEANNQYILGDKSNIKCPNGYNSVSKDQCLEIGKKLLPDSAQMGRKALVSGDWNYVKPGCSLQSGGDWAAHFNTGSGSNSDAYQSVCQKSNEEEQQSDLPTLHWLSSCTQCSDGKKNYCSASVPDTIKDRYQVGKSLNEFGCGKVDVNSGSVSIAENVPNAGPKGVPIKGGVYIVDGIPGPGCYMNFPKGQKCKAFPSVNDKGMTDDSTVGGPKATDKATCDTRAKGWSDGCGYPVQGYFAK